MSGTNAEAESATRDFYGVFFDMFPGWYKKRCIERSQGAA